MIRVSFDAERDIVDLLRHYAEKGRPEAGRNLLDALKQAMHQIQSDPSAGHAAPRPYVTLARSGRAWIRAGRYWLQYTTTDDPTIIAIYHDTADIPGRFRD